MTVPRGLLYFCVFLLIGVVSRQVALWNRNHPRREPGHEDRVLLPAYYPWVAVVVLAVEGVAVVGWLTGTGWGALPGPLKWSLLLLAPVLVPLACWMLWMYRRYYLEITPEWLETVSLVGKPLHIDYSDIVSARPVRTNSGGQLRITDRFGRSTRISSTYYDVSPVQHWLATAERLGRAPSRAEL